ncbi:PQQ-binding-like beta-propeller repeat protein [Novipirellula caenicola]|uniref:Outer membrane protein assembly factor BamB n=1 Tax=Novipirellula caenicola TaxID=1536901 RepID=A0ABP9VV37_9BACT
MEYSLKRFYCLGPATVAVAWCCLAHVNHATAQSPNITAESKLTSTDWPGWRGPTVNGIASSDQDPPLKWSREDNVLWRTPIAGRGHGSPTVLGSRVYLPTADESRKVQLVLCFDRATGKPIWESVVHEGGVENKSGRKANEKATLASSTIATDGTRLYINFINDSAMYTSALNLDGKVLWQTRVNEYLIHQGYGSSPTIYQDLVLVTCDNKAGGAIAALNRDTGDIVWKRNRPELPNYASPIALKIDGREQLIVTGCDLVTSLNPLTGETLWEIEGATTECVTTTVTDGTHVFSSGGYPRNHLAAIVADGSGKIAWDENLRVYVPSLLHRDGYLYLTLDAGVAMCLDAKTGETMWKKRLGGSFTSSPVMVKDRIYATNEDGQTFIFRASPDEYESLGENRLGESVFASAAIAGGQIFLRTAAHEDDKRQEYLYCIGE